MIDKGPSHALQASVLVLNRSYLAVHVTNVLRAVGLLYQDSAEVVDVENGRFANYNFAGWCEISALRAEDILDGWEFIRTVRSPLQVPRVIRLVRFDGVPRTVVRFNRRNLFARDSHQCQYCGTRYGASQLSVDHVVPRSRGGKTTWDNVVCCCLKCNAKKGGRTPDEARMRLIRKPARPRHNPHFVQKLKQPRYHVWRSFLPHLKDDRDNGKGRR